MIRKQFSLEPRQEAALKKLAHDRGVSEAEIMREALDRVMKNPAPAVGPDPAAWDAFEAFVEEWMARGIVPGGRDWTRDDLYEDRMARHGRSSTR